jgi:hypothetical protein
VCCRSGQEAGRAGLRQMKGAVQGSKCSVPCSAADAGLQARHTPPSCVSQSPPCRCRRPAPAAQIGALVSMQSTPLRRGRGELEERAARLEAQYADESVPVGGACARVCVGVIGGLWRRTERGQGALHCEGRMHSVGVSGASSGAGGTAGRQTDTYGEHQLQCSAQTRQAGPKPTPRP